MRIMGVVLLTACLLATTGVAFAKGDGKFSVVPWDVYQEALRWQVMAPGVEMPEVELLLFCSRQLTEEDRERVAKAGYTITGSGGKLLHVSAPIALYIDEEKGLDALGFVTLALPDLPPGTNPLEGDGLGFSGDNLGDPVQRIQADPLAELIPWLLEQGLPIPQ